eukprot:GFUD01086191.1.p1 GENE.GFUD01086191.1~~GFUD01086191.1.p1  ORF type:complete len:120 (-),score=38.62 GFUD01086191.1:18-350(-)
MAMWADSVKFVKDIIDTKYHKIDAAVAEITESMDALEKDPGCSKSREHFSFGLRTLELIQTEDINILLDTILSEVNGKEKEGLENEAKEKITSRDKTIEKANQVRSQLNI